MRTWKASICLIFLVVNSAWTADTVTRSAEPLFGSRYRSARALSMGDAFIAQADDGASALMYNPANLGKLKRFELELSNLQMEANSPFLEKFDRNVFLFPSLKLYTQALNTRSFWNPGAGVSYFPTLSFRGFGAGVFAQSRLWAQNKNGTIRYRSIYQIVPTAGVAIRLASGVIRLGYSVQWINKSAGDFDVPNGLVVGWNDKLYQGSGLSHTAAFSLNIPRTYLPSINLVARNIGGVKYNTTSILPMATNSLGAPSTEQAMYDVGIGFGPRLSSWMTSRLNVDYHDLSNRSGVFIPVKVSVGSELNIRETIMFRFGYGSGYPSAGLGVQGKHGMLSFAWWSEELSTNLWSERDNRYMIQYQFKAFLEPDKADRERRK